MFLLRTGYDLTLLFRAAYVLTLPVLSVLALPV